VIDGFTVEQYADDELAHDIYSLTIDSLGRVVVSGQGYVRILEDTDGDGTADRAIDYADGPKTGAQGMFFVGRDLICSGDDGIIRFRDRNGDDRADAPPDLFLRINAGKEHDAHAIRKGPDGWWYVITGNSAGVTSKYVGLPTSPVEKPQAGTILRLTPDMTKGEVFAHGFRNAYDFDFGPNGDLFAFDSDGEREISLPWYQPTRVFHVLPGSHQGWVTESWKRPDYFFDAPPVVGAFGRSSPTGVVTYQHEQFPPAFRGAMFVLDWTYGRILALRLKPDEGTWISEWIEFMTATGQNGFAPTDAEVGPDGSLFVSIGGRGTRGGVYRIRARQEPGAPRPLPFSAVRPKRAADRLTLCLNAPQPLSSWSRMIWEPLAKELTAEPFIGAAMDRNRASAERIRAIEILTEKFSGLDGDMVQSLAGDPDPLIRARAVWSIGRTRTNSPNYRNVEPFLNDAHPLVVRTALEALSGVEPEVISDLRSALGRQLAHPDRYVRQAMMRLLLKGTDEDLRMLAEIGFPLGWQAAIPTAAAYAERQGAYSRYPVEVALSLFKASRTPALKLEAVRLLQLALGDLVPERGDLDPVFDGYAAKFDLSQHTAEIRQIQSVLGDLYPVGDDELDRELERTMAMTQAESVTFLDQMFRQLTADSHPTDDFHRLIVAARCPAPRSDEHRAIVAGTLLSLERKIVRLGMRLDTAWNDRLVELYDGLVARDPKLPIALLEHPEFGDPGHVQFVKHMPPGRFDELIAKVARRIRNDADYDWNADVVYLLGESRVEEDRELVRSRFEDFALRDAVIMSLAQHPQERDRTYFVAGLETSPFEVVESCVTALGLLSPTTDGTENVALAMTLRRLSAEGEEAVTRDQVVELLRRNLNTKQDYVLGRAGDPQRAAVLAWLDTVRQRFPDEYARRAGESADSEDSIRKQLVGVPWERGDAARGGLLFKQRGCATCHGERASLGPSLIGVTGRFSREDLFIAIALPDRDVSPRYQTVQIATIDGHVHTGLIVYEAVDGVVLRDANNRTIRVDTDQIEIRRTIAKSIMPSGLLKGLTPADLADLNAYLQGLSPKVPQTANAPRTP